MKNFIFRKDEHGFEDWIHSINRMRIYITAHKHGALDKHEDYADVNWWYVNYLQYLLDTSKHQSSSLKAVQMNKAKEPTGSF